MKPILQLDHVDKNYDGPGDGLRVLRDVSLNVEEGDSAAIVGVSGSGKTTLLNIMGLLDRASSGEVWLDGQEVQSLDDDELSGLRNRKIGFVFQMHHLLPQLSVLENVLLPAMAQGGRADGQVTERAKSLLDRLGLGERMDYRPGRLSGGEQQRTAVARALINQPKLLLADEPTGSLDAASRENLADLLVELNKDDGLTVIVVTHSLELARRMRQVHRLQDGKLRSDADGGNA